MHGTWLGVRSQPFLLHFRFTAMRSSVLFYCNVERSHFCSVSLVLLYAFTDLRFTQDFTTLNMISGTPGVLRFELGSNLVRVCLHQVRTYVRNLGSSVALSRVRSPVYSSAHTTLSAWLKAWLQQDSSILKPGFQHEQARTKVRAFSNQGSSTLEPGSSLLEPGSSLL